MAEEEETEQMEKEAVIEKIVLGQLVPKLDDKIASRGRRNADSLFSYIKSMGQTQFPIFCAFAFCNIGFRSAQRKFSFICLFDVACS